VQFANSLFSKLRNHCKKKKNKNRREGSCIDEENVTVLFEGLLLQAIERPNRTKETGFTLCNFMSKINLQVLNFAQKSKHKIYYR
jgi:hypothetical protein